MAIANGTPVEPGFEAPQFDRLNYFYGQMLGVKDFCDEQRYFREKMKLHNRCLHGYGTVCGLRVLVPEPKPECPPDKAQPIFCIEPGLALDPEGNELIVRDCDSGLKIDLWELLSDTDKATVTKEASTGPEGWCCKPLYVCLHYRECPLGSCRPIVTDSCGGTLPNQFGRYRDGVRVSVSLTPPPEDKRCGTCCCKGPCTCDGLLLARIDRFCHDRPLETKDVHNEVRRRLSTYPFTTVTGVNWCHGSHHRRDYVRHVLEKGLIVHFSRPVLVETLARGVVDAYHIETRSTRHPNIIELRGDIASCHDETTSFLRYRVSHLHECPQPGDRVVIVVRCGFILDECCRPVDGLNVGGRVPYVREDDPHCDAPEQCEPCRHCEVPPWGYAPWVSGNGTGGTTFESWFYVEHTHVEEHEEGRAG